MYSHLVVINGSFFEGILPLSHSISRLGCRQNATLMKGATFFTGVRKPVTVPALRFPLSFWLGLDADSGGIWRSSGSRGATWRGERVARKTLLGKMADPTNICWESGMEREMGPHQSLWILAFYSPGGGCFCGHSVVSHPLRGMESLSLCPMPLVNTFLKSFVLFFSRNTWSSHEHTI